MTTGTIGLSSIANPYFNGSGYYRKWSGADGRTEVYRGQLREKWNAYECTHLSRTRSGAFLLQEERFVNVHDPVTGKFRKELQTRVTQTYSGNSPSAPSLSQFTSSMELLLLEKLTNKVRDHRFNLAVFSAEGRKSLSMATSAVSRIGLALRDLKRAEFSSAARRLGLHPRGSRLKTSDVSGRWLELQYGWLPLLSDVHESTSAYARLTSTPRIESLRVSHGFTREVETSSAPPHFSVKGRDKVRRNYIIELEEELSTPRSLGLYNPASVAWELIPYSFVLDWFIPVGAYFDIMGVIPSLNARFLRTTFTSRTINGQGSYHAPNPTDTYQWRWTAVLRALRDNSRSTMVKREVLTKLSVPLPRPSFEGALSPKRLYNAIALAHQRIQ